MFLVENILPVMLEQNGIVPLFRLSVVIVLVISNDRRWHSLVIWTWIPFLSTIVAWWCSRSLLVGFLCMYCASFDYKGCVDHRFCFFSLAMFHCLSPHSTRPVVLPSGYELVVSCEYIVLRCLFWVMQWLLFDLFRNTTVVDMSIRIFTSSMFVFATIAIFSWLLQFSHFIGGFELSFSQKTLRPRIIFPFPRPSLI